VEKLYHNIRFDLSGKLHFSGDKPDETIDTTLAALWNKAYGLPVSAEKASKLSLPDLSEQQKTLLHKLIEQRLNNTPLAYITGRQSFMGIELLCDNRALIPRKETEILGNAALKICKEIAGKKPIVKVFDVCCGAGNLGLALAKLERNTNVTSSDLSHDAVDLTNDNISFLELNHRIIALQSDLFSNFESEKYYGNFDLIVCNPPYISTSKVSKMDIEIIGNEPKLAFDGGMVGLKIIQKFIQESPKFLTEGGWIVFEVGVGQGPFVIQMCEKSALYKQIKSISDDSGNIRVIAASEM
jgi:release factor glutamine methyltransferase